MAIKKFKPQKYTLAQIDQAKSLYMRAEPLSGISRKTGIPRSTLRYYVKESWKDERQMDAIDLKDKILAGRRVQLEDYSILTLDTLLYSMNELRDSKRVLKSAEMLNLAKTLQILDEIALLDKMNKPANHDELLEENMINLEEVIEMDPFAALPEDTKAQEKESKPKKKRSKKK